MTDLATNLREAADNADWTVHEANSTLLRKAADEIERLRQKINRADRYLALGSPNAARGVLNECGTVET